MAKKSRKVEHPVKKGTAYELKVVHKICETLGLTYGEDLKRRPRGEPGNDIVHMTDKAMTYFPISVESKDSNKWELNKWWEKILKDTPEDLIPALVLHRSKTSKDFVMLDFQDFLQLMGIVGEFMSFYKQVDLEDVEIQGNA